MKIAALRSGGVLTAATLVLLSSGGVPMTPRYAAAAATQDSAMTMTHKVTREHLRADGSNDVVDTRTVTVTVSATKDLRDRQGLTVSWSGAHPTGGTPPDPNTGNAAYLEYPMVILQCRGTAATVDPTTCWAPTGEERFQFDTLTAHPAWRLDRYASASDRKQFVLPKPWPAACTNEASDPHAPGSNIQSERWVPFAAADGTKFAGTPDVMNLCGGYPPEAANGASTLALPDNTTFAPTQPDGKGSSRFDVRDAEDNASLGCSNKVACSLVVIPIMGISCDLATAGASEAALDGCKDTGFYTGTQTGGGGSLQNTTEMAVRGQLWWSASNWRNRFVFPLTLAPPANICDIIGGKQPVYVQGSELMTQAATQWSTQFCLDSSYTPFTHVQTPEPQARNGLAAAESSGTLDLPGSVRAAFTSAPPGGVYSLPTVHAPVALTGFAIVFAIDDAEKHTVTQLKLTPRLLAKLLTESYPADNFIQGPLYNDKRRDVSYQALQGNPLNITQDPDFIALNPSVPKIGTGVRSDAASTLMALSSSSDVMTALTSYINADPDARAWLNGKPDPWGMVVNPSYKGIALPLDTWPLLDTYTPKYYVRGTDSPNPCLRDSPVPYLPLVAAPKLSLALISQSMQYAIPNSTTLCTYSTGLGGEELIATEKLVTANRQSPGNRFVLGLASLGDAQRYGLQTASLLSAESNESPFQTFVSPTNHSLRQTFQLTSFDSASGSWPIPYDKIRSDSNGHAYPGAMVVYGDVPTSGLPPANARAYARLLDFAAGTGQTPGLSAGQLPPGYLPMTSANGMGAMVTYTRNAATDVRAQNGLVPPQQPTPPTSSGPSSSSSSKPTSTSGPSGERPPPGSTQTGAGSDGVSGTSTASPTSSPSPSESSSPAAAQDAPPPTGGLHVNIAGFALIVLLILALVGPIGIPAILVSVRRARR